jgi:serine/threonine protein kinase
LLNILEENSIYFNSPIAVDETTALVSQSFEALKYLHDHDVTHRDLKPANVLVYSRDPFVIKLADFGLATEISILQTFCGTIDYAAPQIYQS